MCKSHSYDRNLIQCFQCNLVSVKLFLCVPCRHSLKGRFSSTHTHSTSALQEMDMNGLLHARPPALPLNRRLGGKQNWHGQIGVEKNLFPCQDPNYDSSAIKPVAYSIYQLCYISCLIPATTKSCTMHTAAKFHYHKTKKCSQIIQDSRDLWCIR